MGLEIPAQTVASSRPSGGRTAASGVVAGGQADRRTAAGDVPGVAFNAPMVTIARRS